MSGRWLVLAAVALLLGGPAQAQDPELERSRQRIEEIRAERERLQRQQSRLQGQIQDASSELRNIERQRDATNRLINEIERQIGGLGSQLDQTTAELTLAQDNLSERRAVLERRLVDIYQRGPLYTWRVLLAAESFGELLARYKYLYLTSRQDRSLLTDVERLSERISGQRTQLLSVQHQLDSRRIEREAELRRYSALAGDRANRVAQLRRTNQQTEQRLSTLERDEARLNELLATLERAAAGRPSIARGAGTLTTEDIGRLDWPVEGRLLYRFGRDTLPSGGVIRWNGIGIGAPAGTGVKAVESGRVALVQRLSTYGLTVVVEHGDGFFSLYMQLATATVQTGQAILKSQAIGTVGGGNSDYGPHLHFEIRGEKQLALDPLDWLRRRR
ncbi:MAG: peptidoglycan DD-metalloendopeptidase family protein [Gemmatimonadota bacterium]